VIIVINTVPAQFGSPRWVIFIQVLSAVEAHFRLGLVILSIRLAAHTDISFSVDSHSTVATNRGMAHIAGVSLGGVTATSWGEARARRGLAQTTDLNHVGVIVDHAWNVPAIAPLGDTRARGSRGYDGGVWQAATEEHATDFGAKGAFLDCRHRGLGSFRVRLGC
jgi:hypothetical protein